MLLSASLAGEGSLLAGGWVEQSGLDGPVDPVPVLDSWVLLPNRLMTWSMS